VSRVLNLAHGELMMLGAYILLTTASSVSSSPVIAIAVAGLLSLSVGVLVYLMLMRRMKGESVLAAVLTTIALGILIRGLVTLIWSAQQRYPAVALEIANPSVEIFFGARISLMSILLIATCIVVYSALFTFLNLTRWGIRMRAAGQNPLLAGQRGINLSGIYAMTWGISTFTGALAGMLIALDSGLNNSMMMIGLKAFPAALVGGLDSLVGAVLGSLIVASIEITLIQHVDPLLSDVVPFLVLIAMLIVRPWGIFGSREELDRV
jgi:branched-chain amino acid transport system permease protein